MKVYLAGPMSGYENLNHERFDYWAETFRSTGDDVFNPAEIDRHKYGNATNVQKLVDLDRLTIIRDLLGTDLNWICHEADAIFMLEGWEKSLGARAEHATATALGLKVFYEC